MDFEGTGVVEDCSLALGLRGCRDGGVMVNRVLRRGVGTRWRQEGCYHEPRIERALEIPAGCRGAGRL